MNFENHGTANLSPREVKETVRVWMGLMLKVTLLMSQLSFLNPHVLQIANNCIQMQNLKCEQEYNVYKHLPLMSVEEVDSALGKLKKGKASGCDNLTVKWLNANVFFQNRINVGTGEE